MSKLSTFYSILGKTLGLAIVGAEAYAQANAGGTSSLLQPQNLAVLIQEAEGIILAPAPAATTTTVTTTSVPVGNLASTGA